MLKKLIGYGRMYAHRVPFYSFGNRYNLTLSHEKKMVWFRVAKVGTRTTINLLRESLITLDVDHAYKMRFVADDYTDYFKFTFVRNPWDRLVSCWLDKVVKNYVIGGKKNEQKLQEFSGFVDYVSKMNIRTCNIHFRAQTALIDLGHISFLGRFESFEADLRTVFDKLDIPLKMIPRHNSSIKRKPYQEYYTPALRDKVARIYRKDIAAFGYTF